jgi:hypothetical protein
MTNDKFLIQTHPFGYGSAALRPGVWAWPREDGRATWNEC